MGSDVACACPRGPPPASSSGVVEGVHGGQLVLSDLELLRVVVARRAPDLSDAVARLGEADLTPHERDRIRRAVVDELCELPGEGDGRRALELEELLIRLGRA